jgi:hypothetical protein
MKKGLLDRFGLPPVRWVSILNETSEEARAREATIDRVIAEFREALVLRLGHREAKRRLTEAAKAIKLEPKGRQPRRDPSGEFLFENDKILAMYDTIVRKAPEKRKSAARQVAKKLYPKNVEHAEKRIRRLVKARDERRKSMPRTILGSIGSDETDI